jgi:ABC-2 type transport system permease protein
VADAIWVRLARQRLRADLQYRVSFSLIIVTTFLFSFLDFVAVLVIFGNLHALEGWTFADVALLYGTSGVAFNLANVFVAGVDRAAQHIRAGTFDVLLLRPVSTLVQLSAADIEWKRVGRLAQATMVLAIALASVDVRWTPAAVLSVPLLIVSGAAIYGAIWVMVAAIGFWTVDNRSIANTVTYAGNYMSFYPYDVFAAWLRAIVIVIPLAFVNYLPAARLLGHANAYDLPSWVGLASPAVALAAAIVARSVWAFAVRHYRSTGS